MPLRFLLLAIVSATLGVASPGCGDTCRELARKRCECERTEFDQRSCKRRVDEEASALDVTPEQEEVCEKLLDQCTCARLAVGELDACGLAQESDR
ncbi:MAG: hypothetical protein V3T05_12465 [Myxococcota bacterium]